MRKKIDQNGWEVAVLECILHVNKIELLMCSSKIITSSWYVLKIARSKFETKLVSFCCTTEIYFRIHYSFRQIHSSWQF